MSDKHSANKVPECTDIGLGKQGLSEENANLDHIQANTPEKVKNLPTSLDSQIKTNLHCLDEIMFSNHSSSKPRSTSINMNLIEGLREHDKINSSEDINKLSKPTLEGLTEFQLSVNCFPEGLPTVQLCCNGVSTSVENDADEENNNLRSPPKYQQRQEHEYIPYQKDKIMRNIEQIEEQDTSSQQNKRKPKLLIIQLPSYRPVNRQGNLQSFMDSSPIKEIQSDNSSYRENLPQAQPAGFVVTSKGNGYDAVEALQNDEFTMMFQSNCPIKSPTIPKIKKKHIDHSSSQQGSLSSPMKDSLDKIKESTSTFFKDAQQIAQNMDISQKPIETLTGISSEEFSKKDDDMIEEQLCDPKQIEREAVPINKDALQYGLTDIRSVRNYKVNAFRNRLNLQSQQQQLAAQSNLEGDRNSSGSQCFIPLMNEPVSLIEMQKNQNYNTVETPISGGGGGGQRNMQKPRLSVPPLMPLGRPGHSYGLVEKQNSFESAIQEEGTSQIDVDAPSKRKFQRQLLRIKVDPENSYNKREENTETWDEVVSSDQGPAETILEPKARQGSSNFEDQYTIINQRPLGEGTSGCVYQCVKKTDDDTIYAVKVMRNVDEEMSKSIFQTFGIQYRLQHESVSRVYEVYYNENSQTVHYVMEYIPFRSLDSLLRDKKRTLKETDSSCIVQKLLKAVCYMEQRGVCHRDLKPENILISEDLTQIKIIDFGISKSFVKSQRVQHITQYFKHKMYTPTGTPSYKAPEILQGAGYTQLIDMWDVGVITYQLICKGKHPFKCASQAEQDQKIMTQNYDQTDEYWMKASINAKNFIKQLLRLNRYPAFEALKHPWIEQRKIDVADDDNNRNAIILEKKQSNNTMTTSVPVHFQPRLFNTFNINVTNSEQNQRSDDNDQNPNTNNSQSNEFDCPMGNLNAVVTATTATERQQYNDDGSSVFSSNSGATPETRTRKSNFGKMNSDSTPRPGLRKKHSIQSFSSTQDVVHVVMRQKLSESREKMMQFFLKANSIIKNLEEEQLKLEQNTHPGKTLKRTHSMEKQCDQPASPHNSAAPFLGIDGLSILSSGGLFSGNSSSRINSPSGGGGVGHPSYSQEDIQRYVAGSPSSGTPSAAGPAMQTSFHMSLFSKEAQSSFTSNKNGSSNCIQNNNHQNIDNSKTPSESEKANSSQLSQMPDLNSMKFSSLIARKNSQQNQQQSQQGITARKSKVIPRRNSTLQTNSMEKSIIFIKEVIGELQETFGKEQLQKGGENTPSKKMKIGDYAELLKANNNHNNSGNEVEAEGRTKAGDTNSQCQSQHQQSDGGEIHDNSSSNQVKSKKPIHSLIQQKLLAGGELGIKGLSEKDEEKWKLIAENMENSDSSESNSADNKSQDDCSSSDSGTSSNSDSSEEDRTQSFDLDKFLLKQPDQLIEAGESDIDPSKPIQDTLDNVESPEKPNGNNKSKDSLADIPVVFNPSSQSKPNSLTFSDAKNMGKTGQGIFQSAPYVNYMSSSKDNIINKSLIELQGRKEERHQQPAIVLNTSSASSKENTHIHNRSAEQQPQKHQQNPQQSSHFHHSNSLAQMQSHHNKHHHHHHHTKHSKKNHKNDNNNNIKVSDPQTNLINPPALVTEQIQSQANQNNSQTSNINQTMSSNCSSCGLPNSMQQLQEQKIFENGNEEKLFKNKLPPIPKRGSNEMSVNDSMMGDQNFSFIDMNQSKLVQSFFPNSEDQIPINHSVKKANYLLSMNISQTSSIIAGNISLSNSGNNNTIRSFHGIPLGNGGSGLMANGHVDITGGIQSVKERGNNTNTSKFKWQQSEHNSSSGGSNSQFKKGGKMDFDMSVSEQVSQGDFPLQISQKPFLDNSAFNSSYEATPSKKGQLQKQQPSSNENAQSESNSQSDNSNNTKNSLPLPVAESKPTSQDSSSSLCSSPQKHKQTGSQTGIIDGQNIPALSKENSISEGEEISNKLIENEIKEVPVLMRIERKRSQSRSPRNNSPAGIRHTAGFRPSYYQQNNKQTSNYSTIIEESGETRSCLTSSLAASSKYEFDGTSTTSMGLKLNYTRSLTQINQSIFERNENHAQSLLINFCPPPPPHIHHQNSLPAGHNQVVHSCDDPDTPTGDKLLSNGLTDSPFRRAISVSVKKLSAAGNKNKTKYPVGSRPSSIIGSLSNSKTHSPKITQSQVSQHSFDDFFGTMQKSAFFEEDQQQTAVSQEAHHHFQGGPLTSIKEQEVLEIIPQERHYSDTTNLSQQPPLLKHRKSSIKGALSSESFFEAIAEIIKQNPEHQSTNNEQTKLDL